MAQLAVLVPGGRGQLGRDLAALAGQVGLLHAPGSAELDITDAEAVSDAVSSFAVTATDAGLRPVVINAAAHTAVDLAETEPERAFAINELAVGRLAAAAASRGVPLLHVSTDYVFPGDGTRPYEPTDPTGPKSVYGKSKLAGEQAVLAAGDLTWVVRTAWVYGAGGGNFVKAISKAEGQREQLSVVDDQRGSPTWSADLAAGLLELARTVVAGGARERRVLHCTGGGETTWCGFARAIFEELGADPERVKPCTTEEFPRPAPRPAYSVLSDSAWRAAGLTPLRPWREALAKAFEVDGAAYRP
ncbi:dTDP-4-dehydrorhamnose reductase [Kutzneria viridogrisea]|uniref:dTDP-4-dehydrorhamnose reductase n=1 Tax=Kutzneria viridogrisea TaxID=47990 RepID=A0ABR6BI34_9PSEU|nr:dTDP-4-dehydrorhamnose reductase [Kutzneria viridogrisea]